MNQSGDINGEEKQPPLDDALMGICIVQGLVEMTVMTLIIAVLCMIFPSLWPECKFQDAAAVSLVYSLIRLFFGG